MHLLGNVQEQEIGKSCQKCNWKLKKLTTVMPYSIWKIPIKYHETLAQNLTLAEVTGPVSSTSKSMLNRFKFAFKLLQILEHPQSKEIR